jgi:hypothetical protein
MVASVNWSLFGIEVDDFGLRTMYNKTRKIPEQIIKIPVNKATGIDKILTFCQILLTLVSSVSIMVDK